MITDRIRLHAVTITNRSIDRLSYKNCGLKGAFENFGGHIVSVNLSNCLSMKSLKHALIFDSTVQESYTPKAVKAVLP